MTDLIAHIKWSRDGEFWGVEVSLEDPCVDKPIEEQFPHLRAMATSRSHVRGVAFALEELAKKLKGAL